MFNTIIDPVQMYVAMKKHFQHNLDGIISQINIVTEQGYEPRRRLLVAKSDMTALVNDDSRIHRLARKWCTINDLRMRAERRKQQAYLAPLMASSKPGNDKARRQAKQREQSAKAEAAKDNRAATTPVNKGQGGKKK